MLLVYGYLPQVGIWLGHGFFVGQGRFGGVPEVFVGLVGSGVGEHRMGIGGDGRV